MAFRKRIYEIIEISHNNDKLSKAYDILMMCTILASIIPLAFKEQHLWMMVVDAVTVSLFIIDYMLRWMTADYKKGNHIGFILYPATPMAIIDLLSILPSLTILNNSFKLLKIFRLLRSLKMLRIFKLIRYSKSINMILSVFRSQKDTLITISGIAIGYHKHLT